MSPASLNMTRGLLLLSAMALGVGLVGPCMTIVPAFGAYDGWVRLLDPSLVQPSSYSILSGIFALFDSGSAALGVLLFAFSVAFPAGKLALMSSSLERVAQGRTTGTLAKLAHHAGKFSMLDVFVVGLLVLAIKGMPGETTIQLGWGIYAFALSIVLSLIAGLRLAHAERGPSTEGPSQSDGRP